MSIRAMSSNFGESDEHLSGIGLDESRALLSGSSIAALECRVCSYVFGLEGPKVPRLLLCGHTICHHCLTQLPISEGLLLCPFDRQATPVGDSGIWGLKKNFALVELMEKLHIGSARSDSLVNSSASLVNLGGPLLPLGFSFGSAYYAASGLLIGAQFDPVKERQLGVVCDENEDHLAVLYCTVCESNLCLDCSADTHRTRVLARHTRVPLSQKPRQRPRCANHAAYALEFICLEDGCSNSPLMCILCRDYGRHAKHRHSLLETEATSLRALAIEAVEHMREFSADVSESVRRVSGAIQSIVGLLPSIQVSPVPAEEEDVGGLVLVHETDGGTADLARQQVRVHFAVLREVLQQQEQAALTVVDVYVRERLDVLHQQEDELIGLSSQIMEASYQLERISAQDDIKVVLSRRELQELVSNLRKRRDQYGELPLQINFDTKIPISFTKDNRVHIGPKIEMRVVSLGLDGAGKSSILFRLKHNEVMPTQPTIGFNVETIEFKNLRITIWDVGGHPKLRPLWKHYYSNTQALVFVIDSCDRERLGEVHSELVKLLSENELKDASLLVFANKQDVEGSLSLEELINQLTLSKLCYGRSWHLQPCDAASGRGLVDGLEWLARQLVSSTLTSAQELSSA